MRQTLVRIIVLMAVSQSAWAQDLTPQVFLFGLVPAVNLLLILSWSILSKSFKKFLFHLFLLAIWLVSFGLVSSIDTTALIAWLPVYLSIAHSVILLLKSVLRRRKNRR